MERERRRDGKDVENRRRGNAEAMGTGHAGAEVHHCWVYAEHREDRINARSESPLRAFGLILWAFQNHISCRPLRHYTQQYNRICMRIRRVPLSETR